MASYYSNLHGNDTLNTLDTRSEVRESFRKHNENDIGIRQGQSETLENSNSGKSGRFIYLSINSYLVHPSMHASIHEYIHTFIDAYIHKHTDRYSYL